MSILKNKIFLYLVTRYLTYGLQFILSLIIAAKLGPFYFGVYGMVQLILSYFGQVNLGIPHSLNVFLVHNKDDNTIQDIYTLNSLTLYTYVNLTVFVGAIIADFCGFTKWGEYDLQLYFPMMIIITLGNYYNTIITTVIRFRNQVNVLSLIGTIPVLLNLTIIWFFSNEALVVALIVANVISCIITTIIGYAEKAFPKIDISKIDMNIQKGIMKKGLYLFLYNSCFYFILIAIRSMIGGFYSVEEFGYFTFSYTIANAVMLLLDSLNTIIFPKIIDLLSKDNQIEKILILNKLRVGYITTSHLLIYTAMLCFPFVIYIFPKYEMALKSMNMIALAILMNANSYGYNTLLIAQNKEKISSKISFVALLITLVVGMFLIKVIHVEFSFVIISVMVAYLFFSFLVTYEGHRIIEGCTSVKYTLKNFFPVRLLVPYFLALVISMNGIETIVWMPIIVFLLFNYKDINFLVGLVKKMIINPNIIDLK